MLSEYLCRCRIPDTHVVAGLDLDAVQQRDGDPGKPATCPWVCDDKQRPKLALVEYAPKAGAQRRNGRVCHRFEAILSCRLKVCLKCLKEETNQPTNLRPRDGQGRAIHQRDVEDPPL